RNLGASQVATSSTDSDAYGDLYQWGRGADGHESRTSGTTFTLASSETPGHDDFITTTISPYDWLETSNSDLWQGLDGTNNPCPSGYRLPTDAEWGAEIASWSSSNASGAFASPLKLPAAGIRLYTDGSPLGEGTIGNYWSSTEANFYFSDFLAFSSGNAFVGNNYSRAHGLSVRCIKD
ncbi:MAG: FISUMP domain-containing protein, partial [Bacteroidota bacterium]